jgi:hypothetical protein
MRAPIHSALEQLRQPLRPRALIRLEQLRQPLRRRELIRLVQLHLPLHQPRLRLGPIHSAPLRLRLLLVLIHLVQLHLPRLLPHHRLRLLPALIHLVQLRLLQALALECQPHLLLVQLSRPAFWEACGARRRKHTQRTAPHRRLVLHRQ